MAPSQPRSPMEMVETLQARIQAAARGYRVATVRYLMRPRCPCGRSTSPSCSTWPTSPSTCRRFSVGPRSVADEQLANLLKHHHREERARSQLVLSDLRRLGVAEGLPERTATSGDAALRAYGSNLSHERPKAMLGMLLVFWASRPRSARSSCACSASVACRAKRCAGCSCASRAMAKRCAICCRKWPSWFAIPSSRTA